VSGPGFDELVGEGLEPAERERLRRTDALLRAAGPPAELPPALRVPPGTPLPGEVLAFPGSFPRRRLAASVVVAAAVALAAFGGGYLVAHGSAKASFATDFVVPMQGTKAAPAARAALEVGEIDAAGNWPMRMTIRNLPELPNRGRYELSLTKKGRIAASCGTFLVQGDRTIVFLNAPYKLRQYDDWVVTKERSRRILLKTVKPDVQQSGGSSAAGLLRFYASA
jgi:hypothetical protein